MKTVNWKHAGLFCVLLLVSMTACKKKGLEPGLLDTEAATIAAAQAQADSVAYAESMAQALADSLRQQEKIAEQLIKDELERKQQMLDAIAALAPVRFDFDQSRLLPAAREILQAHAEILLELPDVNIVIEGHCDQNGSDSYNFALGDRRADTVRNYLNTLGVEMDRMRTISYGKTRPVALGSSESIWAKNRRCEFRSEQD